MIKRLFLGLVAGLAFASAVSVAQAQTLTTQDRVNARQVIAEQGVSLSTENLYQRRGFSGGQVVNVTPVYDRSFRTSDGKTVPGHAVAAELTDRRGSSAKTTSEPD
jgi:hypothetical protein